MCLWRTAAHCRPTSFRSGFNPEALTRAVETRERAQQALDEWRSRGAGRTLAFCCSITHADYMAAFLTEQGVAAVAVHSGPTSAPRAESLDRLRNGELDVVCSFRHCSTRASTCPAWTAC